MALRDIVDVQISFEIAALTRVGFGTPLFVTEVAGDSGMADGEIRQYGNLEEVEADFAATDAAFLAAQAAFGQDSGLSVFKVGIKAELDDWPTTIGALLDTDDDWYCLLADTADAADLEAIATNIEARDRLYIAKTADADVLDGLVEDDIASTLADLTLSRTGIIFHEDADTAYPDAAWAGKQLPEDPGSTTWAFKTLSGIPTNSFSSAQRSALNAKRATYYTEIAGNNVTIGGFTSEIGIFIDLIRGRDWLAQRLAEDMFAQLATQPKIPYVGGDAIIEQVIRDRLEIAVDRDVIVPGYSVTVPPASEQQESDRAARVYRDVTFTAQLAGAVHRVEIRGTLTV